MAKIKESGNLMRELEPWERLANGIVLQGVSDWRRTNDIGVIRETERFFRSDWYKQLTNVSGEYLIKKLRIEKLEKERDKMARAKDKIEKIRLNVVMIKEKSPYGYHAEGMLNLITEYLETAAVLLQITQDEFLPKEEFIEI